MELILNFNYLIRYLDVELIIVFGSSLSSVNYDKDIDILIVSNDFKDVLSLKRRLIVKKCVSKLLVDPICLTSSEYRKMTKYGSNFAKQLIQTGRIVYEK